MTTWRYHKLKVMHTAGLRGHLPVTSKELLIRIRVSGITSEEYIQYEGVPQGSLLSTTLYFSHQCCCVLTT